MSATTTSTPMSEVLHLQRSAFHRDGPPSAALRRDRIDRFVNAVVSSSDALVESLSDDFGHRPEVTTLVTDILALGVEAEIARANVGRWMRPRRPMGRVACTALRAVGVRAEMRPSPLGVVGVMGTWNFPINLTAIPAVSALAAGNRVMIKMSEQIPRTADVLANALHDAFDVEEVAVLTGDVAVSQEFAALDLDHLFFTGSAKVGSAVMAAAAKHLTPVTLELGGKNPVVLGEYVEQDRAALRRAAERIAAARLVNGGQVCLSPDEVYVPESAGRTFVQELFNAWGRTMPELFEAGEVTTIVDETSYGRIVALLEDASAKGAQVIGSVRSDDEGEDALREARILSPAVVLGVTDEMDIAHEEIFGPVLAVHTYSDVEDVIDLLAEKPAPLVITWYGRDDAAFRDFVARTRSGGVARNDFALTNVVPGVPFGGVGRSGTGRYHGRFGFDTFSHLRGVAGSDLPISLATLASPSADDRLLNTLRKVVSAYGGLLRRRLR